MDARIQKNMHENNVVIGGGDLFSDALKSAHNSSPAFNLTKSVRHNFDDSNSNTNNNNTNMSKVLELSHFAIWNSVSNMNVWSRRINSTLYS